jgi:hypothetical protein
MFAARNRKIDAVQHNRIATRDADLLHAQKFC